MWTLLVAGACRVVTGRISQFAFYIRSTRYHHLTTTEWPRAFDSTNVVCRRFISSINPRINSRIDQDIDTDKLVPLLSRWLQCPTKDAQHICKALSKAKLAPADALRDYVYFLLQHGFAPITIRSNPWLLEHRLDTVKPQVLLLMSIGVTSDNVPLLKVQLSRLQLVIDKWKEDSAFFNAQPTTTSTIATTNYFRFANRLEYLSAQLECTPSDVAHLAAKHPQFMTFELDRVERVLTLLRANGITADAIKKDPWIIQHNEVTIHDRVLRAREARLPVIKTWMLRCPEGTFANTVDKWCRNRDILREHQDTISYLAQRLNCTREYIQFVAKRNPRLLTINLPKIKQVLDFLYANSYDSSLVCLQPRIFSYSITTLQQRMQDLAQLGYKPKTLDTLCLSAKRFERIIVNLRKNKTG